MSAAKSDKIITIDNLERFNEYISSQFSDVEQAIADLQRFDNNFDEVTIEEVNEIFK